MSEQSEKLPITAWAEDDRPREKLLAKGSKALTDAELIAILLGSGSKNESAVELAKRILAGSANNLAELAQQSISRLMEYKGVGEAKAITLTAALELGRRHRKSERVQRTNIRCSRDAYEYLLPFMANLDHEQFWMIHLDRAQKVIAHEQLSVGGKAGTVVDPKMVFAKALEKGASGLILAHNHPSGNLQPSQADIQLTRKLAEGGKLMDIAVQDHLIFGENAYFSFADEGQL